MGPIIEIPTETLQDRFGMAAVKKGYITSSQFVKALEIQATESCENGIYRFVGEILYEQGLLTRLQLKDVLESMEAESTK